MTQQFQGTQPVGPESVFDVLIRRCEEASAVLQHHPQPAQLAQVLGLQPGNLQALAHVFAQRAAWFRGLKQAMTSDQAGAALPPGFENQLLAFEGGPRAANAAAPAFFALYVAAYGMKEHAQQSAWPAASSFYPPPAAETLDKAAQGLLVQIWMDKERAKAMQSQQGQAAIHGQAPGAPPFQSPAPAWRPAPAAPQAVPQQAPAFQHFPAQSQHPAQPQPPAQPPMPSTAQAPMQPTSWPPLPTLPSADSLRPPAFAPAAPTAPAPAVAPPVGEPAEQEEPDKT